MKKNIILLTLLISIITLNYLTKPQPLSFDESIKSIEVVDDNLKIEFKDNISNFKVLDYTVDNRREVSVEAYKQTLSFNKNKEAIISNINSTNHIYFTDFKNLDKVIYGDSFDNQMTLPRLTLNYYYSIALIATVLLLSIKFLFKTKKFDKIIIVSVAYLGSGFINMYGISQTTHYLIRDLSYNLVLTVLMFMIFNRVFELYKS